MVVVAGDLVLCEPGTTCDSSSTTNWSDVVVFGPSLFSFGGQSFADTVKIYSNDDGTLSSLLSNNFTLSSNAVFLTEDASGITHYDPVGLTNGQGVQIDYYIHSPESGPSVPEPSSLTLLLAGFVALGLRERNRAVAY